MKRTFIALLLLWLGGVGLLLSVDGLLAAPRYIMTVDVAFDANDEAIMSEAFPAAWGRWLLLVPACLIFLLGLGLLHAPGKQAVQSPLAAAAGFAQLMAGVLLFGLMLMTRRAFAARAMAATGPEDPLGATLAFPEALLLGVTGLIGLNLLMLTAAVFASPSKTLRLPHLFAWPMILLCVVAFPALLLMFGALKGMRSTVEGVGAASASMLASSILSLLFASSVLGGIWVLQGLLQQRYWFRVKDASDSAELG